MFSVGILYSSQELLSLVGAGQITKEDFINSFVRFKVASADVVFKQCIDCGWLEVAVDGSLSVSSQGKLVLAPEPPELRLRTQLVHLIDSTSPSWISRVRYGRGELEYSIPPAVRQCFDEAGLFEQWTDELIAWWDKLASAVRMRKNDEALATGRKAERLSLEHEERRLGKRPVWQALDTSISGYDILSSVSAADETPMCIEVKGTTQRKNEAFFHISRNEWDTAQKSAKYVFDLWMLRGEPVFKRIEATDLIGHIPKDFGTGQWKQAALPFKAFFQTSV